MKRAIVKKFLRVTLIYIPLFPSPESSLDSPGVEATWQCKQQKHTWKEPTSGKSRHLERADIAMWVFKGMASSSF